MTARIRVSASDLKAKLFSREGTGMIHDHATQEVVVRMSDGTEYACSFEEHAAALGRTTPPEGFGFAPVCNMSCCSPNGP